MLLTILTPTYNRRIQLSRLYVSLQQQTDLNFQWLIIDDGSEDGTEEWIRNEVISKSHEYEVDYIYKENGGKHSAINYAHPYIQGNYVVIVDSDDWLTRDAVASIKKLWDKYGENINVAGITFQKGLEENRALDSLVKGEYVSTFKNEINRGMMGDHCETFRKDIFVEKKFPEYEGETFVAEGALWYLITKGYDVIYSDKVVYICEYLEEGLSKSGRPLRIRNPRGGRWHANVFMDAGFNYKIRLKNALLYSCYSHFLGEGIKQSLVECNGKGIVLMAWFPGWILFKYWKNKYGK